LLRPVILGKSCRFSSGWFSFC